MEQYESYFNNRVYIIKNKDCMGCEYNEGSQRHHTCLKNDFDQYYSELALEELLKEELISKEFYIAKKRELVLEYPPRWL